MPRVRLPVADFGASDLSELTRSYMEGMVQTKGGWLKAHAACCGDSGLSGTGDLFADLFGKPGLCVLETAEEKLSGYDIGPQLVQAKKLFTKLEEVLKQPLPEDITIENATELAAQVFRVFSTNIQVGGKQAKVSVSYGISGADIGMEIMAGVLAVAGAILTIATAGAALTAIVPAIGAIAPAVAGGAVGVGKSIDAASKKKDKAYFSPILTSKGGERIFILALKKTVLLLARGLLLPRIGIIPISVARKLNPEEQRAFLSSLNYNLGGRQYDYGSHPIIIEGTPEADEKLEIFFGLILDEIKSVGVERMSGAKQENVAGPTDRSTGHMFSIIIEALLFCEGSTESVKRARENKEAARHRYVSQYQQWKEDATTPAPAHIQANRPAPVTWFMDAGGVPTDPTNVDSFFGEGTFALCETIFLCVLSLLLDSSFSEGLINQSADNSIIPDMSSAGFGPPKANGFPFLLGGAALLAAALIKKRREAIE